jgi:hypothetical protein
MEANDQTVAAEVDEFFQAEPAPAPANVEAGQAPVTSAEEPQAQPKGDPSRFEYWQSQADQYKRQVEQLSPYVPLIQYLNENPNAVQAIQQTLNGPVTSSPQANAAQAQQSELTPPTQPAKPEQYDDVAAYQDPQSASFQYRRKMEGYRDDMLGFYAKKEEARDQAYKREQGQRAAEIQQRQQISRAQAILQSRYGFKPQEAIDFVQVMSQDSAVNMDNLVKLYRVMRGGSAQSAPISQQLQQRQNMGPASPGISSGVTEPQINEGDEFNLSLQKYKHK